MKKNNINENDLVDIRFENILFNKDGIINTLIPYKLVRKGASKDKYL